MKKLVALLMAVMMMATVMSFASAEEGKVYDLQGKTVKIRLWDSPNPYAEDVTDVDKERYLPIYEAAKAKYNCEFDFFTSAVEWDDMPAEFANSVASGQPVWHISNNISSMWLGNLSANNAVADISKALESIEMPTLLKTAGNIGDASYGFITGYPGTEGLVFNRAMIEEAGMEYSPAEMFEMGKWSYDDFFAYVSELQSKLPEGTYSFFIDPNYWQIFAATANGSVAVNSDFTIGMTSDAFIECIEFLQKLQNAGVTRPVNVGEDGSKSYWGTPSATFDAGVEVAMTHRATWQMGGLNTNGLDWGFVPYPWGKNVTLATEGDYTSLSDNYRAAYYDLGVTGTVLAGFENDFAGLDYDYVLEALVNLSYDLFVDVDRQAELAQLYKVEIGEAEAEETEIDLGNFQDELSVELYNWLTTRTQYNNIAMLYNSNLATTDGGETSFPGLIRRIVEENESVRSALEAAAVEIEAGLKDGGLAK